jgi:hypothetical protein
MLKTAGAEPMNETFRILRTGAALMGLAALLLSSAWPVSAEIYQWKDERGDTVFSQHPPRDVPSQVVNPHVSKPSAEAMEKLKAQTTPPPQPEAAPQAAAAAPEPSAAERKANCEKARKILSQLESSTRLRYVNEQGDLSFLSEDERQSRMKSAQESIKSWCK